ncbi:MAG: hypothetical protein QOI16_988 [Pseudonocardiales bacterium]|nr:hypothetical protein [Pseudonocardiales bacterium]
MTNNQNILVVGGTGKTGSRVAARLAALGRTVRIGSRGGTPSFDWADPGTWATTVEGVDAAYLSYYPDVSFPGAADVIGAFARRAVEAGVGRLVLLSGRGEPDAEPAERAVRDAGAEWTVLRCAWFAQNFSEHFLLGPVLDGAIALPAGTVTEPFLDVEDVADVAVIALTCDGHQSRTYELTGPRLLGFADAAAEVSAATGREVAYLPVTPAEYAAGAAAAGVPEEEIIPLTELFTRVLDGHNSHVSHDVESVLGRPARDFADYAARTARTGVWPSRPAEII